MWSKVIKKDKTKLIEFLLGYLEDVERNLFNNRNIKEKAYSLDLDENILNELTKEEIMSIFYNLDNYKIYLPVTTAVYDDMRIINGDEVDLNDGLEAEYIEGFSYMPTSGKMIDIGEVNVSINSRVAIILEIKNDSVKIEMVEGRVDRDSNLKSFRRILNSGIVSIELSKYLEVLINL